jgi:hypothetical protein
MTWIDVAKEWPDANVPVLTTGFSFNDPEKERWFVVATRIDDTWLNYETGDDLYPPTHWMALTEPT